MNMSRPPHRLTSTGQLVWDHVVASVSIDPQMVPVLTVFAITAARYAQFVDEYSELANVPGTGNLYRDCLARDAEDLLRWADALELPPAARALPVACPPLDPSDAGPAT